MLRLISSFDIVGVMHTLRRYGLHTYLVAQSVVRRSATESWMSSGCLSFSVLTFVVLESCCWLGN